MPDQKQLTMTIMLGLPGAGKSTHVKQRFANPEPKRLVICMDDLRKAFGYEYKEEFEFDVLGVARVMAHRAFQNGYNVVIDESVTDLFTAGALVELARAWKAQVEMVEVTTPLEVCYVRRVPLGFPDASFLRKAFEWKRYKAAILGMADKHITADTGVV